MTQYDTLVSAQAWDQMVKSLKALGPNPPHSDVVDVVISVVFEVEGITLDEDHR